jgi:hypothetical protein
MSKIPGPERWVYRFVAGHPMDGHYRTDARFFRRGTRLLAKVEVHRWSYLPGWQRSAWRFAGVLAVLTGAWGYAFHRERLYTALVVGAVLAALYASWRLWEAWQRHAVLGPMLGLPSTTRPTDYLTVPKTYRTKEETPAVIRLPMGFNPAPANKDQVSNAAMSYLRINDDNTDVTFHMSANPTLELKMAPQPPNRVLWADYTDLMLQLPAGQIFVGLQARNAPYIRDFNVGEVVHGGFSVNTGGGKSNAAMTWISQMLHSDPRALVTFVDPKQSALPACLVGVPGYSLANDPDNIPEMWDVIERFEREIIRRRRARIDDPTMEFPLMYLILDELSEFMDMSREFWEEVKEEPERYGYEGKLSKRPPIIRSIARILRMSREYGGRVLVFTQRLDNASTGGIGLRDLFGWRGLAGFRKNQWMMLIQTTPIPKSIRRVGRWIYSDGDKEVWVQNVYASPEQLREWAVANRRAGVDTHDGQMTDDGVSPAESGTRVQWEIVGLAAAADYVRLPYETFRKRRRHHGPIAGEGLQGRSPAWMKVDLDKFLTKEEANADQS